MSEVVFIVWLTLTGAAALLPLTGRLPRFASTMLALPLGVSIYALSGLAIVAARAPFSTVGALTIGSSATTLVVLGPVLFRRRDTARLRAGIVPGLFTTAVVATIAAVIQIIPAARFTTDSFRYLISAGLLEQTGALASVDPFDLRMRQLVTPLLHTWGTSTGSGYVATITPLVAFSGFGIAGWLSWEGFRLLKTPHRWRIVITGAMVWLLLATNRVLFHSFYINGHMLFAVLLVAAVGLGWIGALRKDPGFFWPAGLMLAALVPLRPEAVLTIIVFLLPFLVAQRTTRRGRWILSSPFIISALVWNGATYPFYARPEDLGLLGPAIGPAVVACVFAGVLAARDTHWGHRLSRHVPRLAVTLLLAYVAISAVFDPATLIDTLRVTWLNMLRFGMWGVMWWVFVPLIAGAIIFVRFPLQRLWAESLPLFAALYLTLPYLRGSAFRLGWSDSGNRILLHSVFVVATYLMISAAALIRDVARDEDFVIDLREFENEAAPTAPYVDEPGQRQVLQPAR